MIAADAPGSAAAGAADDLLLELLRRLSDLNYRFVTVTPETHRRVVDRRADDPARDLRDIFGWSLPFSPDRLPAALFDLLSRSDMIGREAGLCRSRIRVSSIDDRLFLHSAYPTDRRDSVFLGPDSYRFVRFLRPELRRGPPVRHLVDVGAGAGVGAIVSGLDRPEARLTVTDINPLALRFAGINASHAAVRIEPVECSGVDGVSGAFDLAIMNPPFIRDPAKRAYRDGGGMHGAALSLGWALDAARRVAAGGRVLLYTGSAIIAGQDRLESALRAGLPADCTLSYAELDSDIFGEQLDSPGYEEVERIAAVGAVITKTM